MRLWPQNNQGGDGVLRRLWARLQGQARRQHTAAVPPPVEMRYVRPAQTHVILLDGTMSSLVPECQTNLARTYMLLREVPDDLVLYYEAGLQWRDWRSGRNVLLGRGINAQIKRAYSHLASRYRPGDRIFLMGYSRGAFAVRSLAGVLDRVGLLRAEHATERNIRTAYRHYECAPDRQTVDQFRRLKCHDNVQIEMIGVWDTVKSLGINAPVLWRISERWHAFHDHSLSNVVKNGFHALAMDETRVAYKAIPWVTSPSFQGHVQQMWFPGTHGDVGGQLGGFNAARPLANIPLVWLLTQAEGVGLPLPAGWAARFAQDATAPSVGTWRGYGRLLITRRKRIVGADASEQIHPSVAERIAGHRADKPRWSLRRA
jgi:uncharacterized protein (DUF2235 family)